MRDIGIIELPILHSDSQSATMQARNPVFHAKKKHIEVRYRHSRKLVIDKKLEIQKFDNKVNITDSQTKPLPGQCFNALRGHMGLQQASQLRKVERKAEGKSK